MASYNYGHGPWPPGSSADGPAEEIRTIFVLGFPQDVKERELQNLLRWWPGYDACQMNFKGEQPMGFALFSTAAMAMAARDALQNLVFDAETNSVLRAEMAKKNLYVKMRKLEGGHYAEPNKRSRTGAGPPSAVWPAPPDSNDVDQPAHNPSSPGRVGYSSGVVSSYTPSAGTFSSASPFSPSGGGGAGIYPPAWAQPSFPPQGFEPYGGYPPAHSYAPSGAPSAPGPVAPVVPAGYAPVQNMKDNPPCNTLFIGNLGEMTSEAELRGLFSSQPRFRKMKVLRNSSGVLCFVEFDDVSAAADVHKKMQGAILTSSNRGPMRLQYSKNPFGTKGRNFNLQEGPGGPAGNSMPLSANVLPADAAPGSTGAVSAALDPVQSDGVTG